ncbi:HAD-IIA family hydrolase (plasmid) [Halorussus salilacus]|uniref:HAD-IIA family hydrolase n=1 Tax=Halorussus salilacus TaxID=2953750 RepID=UPI00209CA09C|nr:HAD-IIA family hydrolase [Halorussus salilacus]USZ69811.1 HAD-IIA family hydrolase [Halorussus salilacus]
MTPTTTSNPTPTTYAGALVDLDGTVYRGDELLPGVEDGVAALRQRMPVLFLSNKAVERRADYAETLTGMGIPTAVDEVLNSATVTADYLAREFPDGAALVVGEAPLVAEIRAAGVAVTDSPADADVVVASMDRAFDYETLTDALRALDPEAEGDGRREDETAFVATNPDRTCPVASGEIPDAAGMIGAIEGVTGREVDRVLGKPSETTVAAATAALDAPASECLMVGDRLETDIAMGERAGMTTVLVLTGVTDRDEIERSAVSPDHVVDSLADIGELL